MEDPNIVRRSKNRQRVCLAKGVETNNSHAPKILTNCVDGVNAKKIGGKKHLGLKQIWMSKENFSILKMENMVLGESSFFETLNRIVGEYYTAEKRNEILKKFEETLK